LSTDVSLPRRPRAIPADDALDFGDRVDARVERPVVGAALGSEIQAASELAHDEDVDAGEAIGANWRGRDERRSHLHRPKIRVQ
jgi:hypothetical protein